MSVASTDEFAEFTGATNEEEKGDQPLDKPTVGDSTKNIENSKKTGNFDDQSHQTENIERDVTGESRDLYENVTEYDEGAERPKRIPKPSTKSIENRIQADKAKLGKLWGRVQKAIAQLQESPNSLDEIRSAISQVRSTFYNYHALWVTYMDFLANAGTPECHEVRETEEHGMYNRKQFVDSNVAQANERKEEILLEMGSMRTGSRVSSMSSTALRAKARADAAAAKKKLELQKRRSLLESESALRIQQQEFALVKQKMDEQSRLETLRLEEAAAVAEAKADAIDDELGIRAPHSLPQLNLPVENPGHKVQRYIENQCFEPTVCDLDNPLITTPPQPTTEQIATPPQPPTEQATTPPQPPTEQAITPPQPSTEWATLPQPPTKQITTPPQPSTEWATPPEPPTELTTTPAQPSTEWATPPQPPTKQITTPPRPSTEWATPPQPSTEQAITPPQPSTEQITTPPMLLNPSVSDFTPRSQHHPTPAPDQSSMKSYIEFMARRELIANKIEKFDNKPENFHTWKLSFKNMTRNISITPSEELSLLIEYSTGDSKRLVQQLRNAYIENPGKGVAEAWKKLGERYGSDVVLTKAHLDKLTNFPKIGYKDNKKLQEFGDLLLELQCAKEDGGLQGLKILDEPIYIKPILSKLPNDIQGRWQRHAFRYTRDRCVHYPPFSEFSKFIQDISLERNDPNLAIDLPQKDGFPSQPHGKPRRETYKTEITGRTPDQSLDLSNWCIIHQRSHPLSKCRVFQAKPIDERKNLLRQHRVCFRCLASRTHMAKDCKCPIKCTECQSDRHLAALHIPRPERPKDPKKEEKVQGREPPDKPLNGEHKEGQQQGGEPKQITASCTEVCKDKSGGRSCSKICVANIYLKDNPNKKIEAYVVIDDQSNCSLAKSKLFDSLDINGKALPYTLRTCAGTTQRRGRQAKNLIIETLDGNIQHTLPTITECNAIPDNKDEIPTPEVAMAHPHLRSIANQIPEVKPDTDILLLIGRDAPPLHKVRESRNGKGNSPWGQRLDLGWVILGNACLDGVHRPNNCSSFKTHMLPDGRPTIFEPCANVFHVKIASNDVVNSSSNGKTLERKESFVHGEFQDGIAKDVFLRTRQDNTLGLSVEDRKFIELMEASMEKDVSGNWVAPLPFRHEVTQLPNSREEAYKRLRSTRKTLDRKPRMKEHYFTFMQKVLDNGHAEPIPPDEVRSDKPCWYLPHFGVYHPQKPDKIRVVFDSAAETDGISLNKLLLSGPDFTNSLLGVLLRFRQDPTAFMVDIEQMFHSFNVREDHRDFLRFLWFKENNPEGPVSEFRMKVHLFGNTSSPAVATFGLRKTAQEGELEFGSDARKFVEKNFYVDDGLKSLPSSDQAIDLLRRTQAMLATANLRLHKIASNNTEVMQAFSSNDRATDLRDLDLNRDSQPVQRSLGVYWDLGTDTFTFKVDLEDKPFTRRGVLSVVNSLFDPMGIAAPVVIKGKMLLRSMSAHFKDRQLGVWDEPLPEERKPAWQEWCKSLSSLQHLRIPRAYASTALAEATLVELHTFCDASVQGIAAVCFMRSIQPDGRVQVSFVFGKAKLSPPHATTIPRLELCAAVLAVEITNLVREEQVAKPDSITYYSDSKVVLGYITNEMRRFYVYVSNRVERIRKSSSPDQWRYVPTDLNPADLATRSLKACDLKDSAWLTGPKFLYERSPSDAPTNVPSDVAFEPAAEDPELRPEVKTFVTQAKPCQQESLGTSRFLRFSRWSKVVNAVGNLILVAQKRHHGHHRVRALDSNDSETETTSTISVTEARVRARKLIIRNLQNEAFQEELDCLERKKNLPKTSPLIKLSPILDSEGLLRIGGRLEQANLPYEERHPLILTGKHHLTRLIVEDCHEEVKHQGRHFTHGMVRGRGFWVVGGKRLVNRVINHCLKCKKLRGKLQHQKMADLPTVRLTPSPPFTFVGIDVFGPWEVVARRTRGGHAYSKRWAVIFTCLTARAIHIELIESMDASCFINALRRFVAIRGPVAQIHSDCGTNFTGAVNEMETASKEGDQKAIESYVDSQGIKWVFNSPHASHMGGVWERMIGICRRILDAMFADLKPTRLTHEVLSTLMAEVTAIVNNRPLVAVSDDPSIPEILTPSILLTQKTLPLTPAPGNFVPQDLYRKQWRQVQYLANQFWSRWRKEFLPTLQSRRKWETATRNLQVGDLVLLRCKEVPRNDWPLARISKTFSGEDGKVRKVEITTAKNGSKRSYTRPVAEVVLLKTEHELNS